MIRSIVNKYLKTFLGEIFLDAPSIQLSMGADLFSEAKIQMDNLSLRPDIFDVYLQPLKLVSGHVGRLTVDGITDLAINGKLKFSAENIFLLFQIDTSSDAEHIQTLKKIQIEMQSGRFSDAIFRDLLEKLQGFVIGKDSDVDKKRKEVFKAIDTLFHGLNFSLKNIHIRIEMKQIQNINVGPYKTPSLYSSIGIMIPFVKFSPESGNNSPKSNNNNNSSTKVNFLMKNIHIYCDYDRDSYTSNGRSDSSIANQFNDRYKSEKHYSIVAPFDIETIVSLSLKKKNGLLIPQFSFKIQSLRYFFDSQQVEVLRNFTELFSFSHKRFEQLTRMQKIFRNGFPLPRMFEVGGVKVLPHLLIRGKVYPNETKLSAVTTKSESLVMFMKERVGNKWSKMMWKHVIRLVLHDLRKIRPLGRWIEIARLSFVRKEYAFIYSKLLKKSKETGLYSYDVNANVRQELLRQLFEYEMMLPVKSTIMFRTLAVMVATVEDFNSKKAKAKQSQQQQQQQGKHQQAFEKVSITWLDILRVFTEVNEAKRESAFHRFDKKNFDDDHFLDDEVATSRASDEGSVYSYSLHSRTHVSQPSSSSSPSHTNNTNNNNNSNVKSSNSSPHISNTLRNSVKSVSSMQSTAFKMIGSMGSSVNGAINGSSSNSTSSSSITTTTTNSHKYDEYDAKVSKKFDLSVFSDLFTTLNEKEDKVQEKEIKQVTQTDLTSKEPVRLNLYDWHLGGSSPSIVTIAEVTQWAMLRHQPSVVLMPPDVNINIDSLSVDVKTPINCGIREKVISFIISSINCNVMISQSSNNGASSSTNKSTNSNGTIRSLKGFASLSGALLQLRLVVKQFSTVIYIDKSTEKIQSKNSPVPLKSEKGSLLSSGLPLYPISESLKNDHLISSTLSSEQGDNNSEDNDDNSSDGASQSNDTKSINLDDVSNKLKFTDESSNNMKSTDTLASKSSIAPVHVSHSKTSLLGDSTRTIESSHSIANTNSVKIDTGSATERKIIFISKDDTFLILCIILDLDDKGEGAADTQLQFGAIKVDLDKLSIATLVSIKSIENFTKIMRNFTEFRELISILAEYSVIIDRSSKLPVVEMHNNNNDDDMDIKALNRAAIIYNKNIHQWIGILEDMLPKVLSICIRFSKIEIDFVEYFVIRDFINSKIQLIIDRAALRLRHNSQINMLDSIVGVLSNMLNLNSNNKTKLKSKHHSKREEAQLHPDNIPVRSSIVIPAIELVVAKSTTPYPLLDIHIKDLQIKVPITDDTLIFLIALTFSNILPFYY